MLSVVSNPFTLPLVFLVNLSHFPQQSKYPICNVSICVIIVIISVARVVTW